MIQSNSIQEVAIVHSQLLPCWIYLHLSYSRMSILLFLVARRTKVDSQLVAKMVLNLVKLMVDIQAVL